MPNATMGDDLAVSLDGKFGAYEAIGELARFDAKRAHVLCHRWRGIRGDTDWLKHHLQDSVAAFACWAVDKHPEMR